MLKLLLPTCLTFLLFSPAHSQAVSSLKSHELYPGYIVKLKGDTARGFIENTTADKDQSACIFYTSALKSGKPAIYKASEIKAFGIADLQFRSVNFKENTTIPAIPVFMLMIKPGAISTFVLDQANSKQTVWQKSNGTVISEAALEADFKTNALKLLGDDAVVRGKIERNQKGYGLQSILDIIAEYNKAH